MRRLVIPALCVVAAMVSTSAQTQVEVGRVVSSVVTRADASQSYALYLPTQYRPDRAWPLLVAFHPAARGQAFVDLYREAAEDYGYIVAGSNTSRNGAWAPSLRAAEAMIRDVSERFSIDPARLYATGFSGGARVATQIALQSKLVAGVITSGAGFPDAVARRKVDFDLAATIGTSDFNYGELRALDRALSSPHRVFLFAAGHVLPPPAVARQSLEWLELRAMIRGLRPRDEAAIARWWQSRLAEAEATEDVVVRVTALEGVADDFAAVRDVAELRSKTKALRAQPDVRKALSQRKKLDDEEVQLLTDVGAFEARMRIPDQRDDALFRLRAMLSGLHRRAQATADTPERRMVRRVLYTVMVGARERIADDEYLAFLATLRIG